MMEKYHGGKSIVAICPDGSEVQVEWLADFCRERGLNKNTALRVLKGEDKYKSVKGYRFLYADQPSLNA